MAKGSLQPPTCLVRAAPIDIGSPSSSRRALAWPLHDPPANQRDFATGNVGKGHVDREPFDQRRAITQNLDRGIAQTLMSLKWLAAGVTELGHQRAPAIPPTAPPPTAGCRIARMAFAPQLPNNAYGRMIAPALCAICTDSSRRRRSISRTWACR